MSCIIRRVRKEDVSLDEKRIRKRELRWEIKELRKERKQALIDIRSIRRELEGI